MSLDCVDDWFGSQVVSASDQLWVLVWVAVLVRTVVPLSPPWFIGPNSNVHVLDENLVGHRVPPFQRAIGPRNGDRPRDFLGGCFLVFFFMAPGILHAVPQLPLGLVLVVILAGVSGCVWVGVAGALGTYYAVYSS